MRTDFQLVWQRFILFSCPKKSVIEMADTQQSRFEKSLGLLTTRFVSLLQKARDGVLDLKVVIINNLYSF